MKYRKSLRPKVFLKLLVLLTADSIDPNVWSRKGIVRNLFANEGFDVTEDFFLTFQPDHITPETGPVPPGKLNPNHIYENLERVSGIFQDSGIEVIWVAPPLSHEKKKGNYSKKFTGYYQTIAHKYGSNFYDYAGLGLDEEFLRDPTHLNGKGRALFSLVLAKRLAGHFEVSE